MKLFLPFLICLLSNQAFAKFSGPYPDSPDFPTILQQAFQRLTGAETLTTTTIPTKCKAISLDNKTALADFDLLTGFPYASSINPSFWTWYFDCIQIIATNTILNSEDGFKNSLGFAGSKYFAEKPLKKIKETLWQTTPSVIRIDIAHSIINTVIRDDLLAEFGDDPQKIITEIETTLNHPSRSQFKVDQALMVILQTVLKQKSFILE